MVPATPSSTESGIVSDIVASIPTPPDTTVMSALRGLRGRATLGDVVSATGMPDHEAETALKSLLETHRGHLEVSDAGDLLYQFDPKLISRDAEPFWTRFRRTAWSAFKVGFKVWTAVMLVVYFAIFVLILVAIMLRGSDDRGFGGRGGFSLGDFFILHWLLGGRGWNRGSLYYGHAHARRLPKDARPPFYKRVFAFIFGPDEPKPTQLQKDRSVVQLIRARKGVLTSSELIEHTALSADDADEEMGRLTGAYGGDPQVSDAGEVVYAFPELMKSAHGKVRASEPKPAWMRLEYPKKLTGNSLGSNWGIGTMNGFNLLMATMLGMLPGMSGVLGPNVPPLDPLIFYGLGVVPFTFSSLFFGIPIVRSLGLGSENRARMRRNIRRLLLGLVYARSVGTVRWIPVGEAIRHVTAGLKDQQVSPKMVLKELERLAAEFDADVEADDDGFRYRFPAIRETFVEAELMRRRLKLQDQKLGRIVYATSDTAAEESQRELDAFDRELKRAEIDLSRYLPSPDRVGYEEDFEVVMERAPVRAARTSGRRRPQQRRPPPRWR